MALGGAADASCQPPIGAPYIDYNQIDGTSNLPAGQALTTTFGCMASLGDKGCGFQQDLEAVYQALHNPPPENAGFLRDDALLVVFFLVDEDDCSLPPDSDLGDPSPAAAAAYGNLSSFRCVRFGVACGDPATPIQPVDSNGPLPMCRPLKMAEGGKLIDVQKYIDYFTLPASMGGVKADPRDVILAAIAPPPEPVSITVHQCSSDPNAPMSCPWENPSCVAPGMRPWGNPTVRLTPVVQSAATSQLTSLCDTSFQSALQSLGQMIVSRVY